jgi:hypothetical protein
MASVINPSGPGTPLNRSGPPRTRWEPRGFWAQTQAVLRDVLCPVCAHSLNAASYSMADDTVRCLQGHLYFIGADRDAMFGDLNAALAKGRDRQDQKNQLRKLSRGAPW